MNQSFSSWKTKLLLAVLWANFVVLWIGVYWITTVADVKDSINYLGGLISAYGLFVAAWIYHNVRIYRKKGPRSTLRAVAVSNTHDVLKRKISRQVDLKSEQEIAVTIVNGTKVFVHNAPRPETLEQPEEMEVLILR